MYASGIIVTDFEYPFKETSNGISTNICPTPSLILVTVEGTP
jgi:hypothetical protein